MAEIRTLFGLVTEATMNDEDIVSVVPHELAHLVFDTAVKNPYRFPPTLAERGTGDLPVGGLHAAVPEPASRTRCGRGTWCRSPA